MSLLGSIASAVVSSAANCPSSAGTDGAGFSDIMKGQPAAASGSSGPVLLAQNAQQPAQTGAAAATQNGHNEYVLSNGVKLNDDVNTSDGKTSHRFSLTMNGQKPDDVVVIDPIKPGVPDRFQEAKVTDIGLSAFSYSDGGKDKTGLTFNVSTARGPNDPLTRYRIGGDPSLERPSDVNFTEDMAVYVKHYIDKNGGLDKYIGNIDTTVAESKLHGFDIPKDQVDRVEGKLKDLYNWGIQAEKFSSPDFVPSTPAERVVKNAQKLEADPNKFNGLLEKIGKQYGIPGGARAWTEWLNDSNEVPIANSIIKATSRLKNVTPEELATVAFGEGVGFFEIGKYLGNDYKAFNNRNVSGMENFGLDEVGKEAPELRKKGYLPPDLQLTPVPAKNERAKVVSGVFKSFDDTMVAAGAVLQNRKDHADEAMQRVFGKLPSDYRTRFFYTYVYFNVPPKEAEQVMAARGVDYIPKWSGPPPPNQQNTIYNATLRTAQLDLFIQSGIFNQPKTP